MALGILAIIYIVLIITTLVIQVLLYKGKNESKNSIFIVNILFVFLLSFIVFSSLPTNYIWQRILAIVWPAISILAIVVKIKAKQFILASKVMISVSIFGCLIQLFL